MYALLTSLNIPLLGLVTWRLNLDSVYMDGIFVQFSNDFFTSRSVALPMRSRISRKSFLVFPTLLLFYALLGGLDAALSVGGVDGDALALASGVGDGGVG